MLRKIDAVVVQEDGGDEGDEEDEDVEGVAMGGDGTAAGGTGR